jgi:hypothetical protein
MFLGSLHWILEIRAVYICKATADSRQNSEMQSLKEKTVLQLIHSILISIFLLFILTSAALSPDRLCIFPDTTPSKPTTSRSPIALRELHPHQQLRCQPPNSSQAERVMIAEEDVETKLSSVRSFCCSFFIFSQSPAINNFLKILQPGENKGR